MPPPAVTPNTGTIMKPQKLIRSMNNNATKIGNWLGVDYVWVDKNGDVFVHQDGEPRWLTPDELNQFIDWDIGQNSEVEYIF